MSKIPRLTKQDTVKSGTHHSEDEGHSSEIPPTHDDESLTAEDEATDAQSDWGRRLPEEMLMHIFSLVCQEKGCIPFLLRASEVCQLWNRVASINSLWKIVNLSGDMVKRSYRTDNHLKWLFSNKLTHVNHLHLGGWDATNNSDVLEAMCKNCQKIETLSLSGWKGLSTANLAYVATNLPHLSRLDLSRLSDDGSVVTAQSLTPVFQIMADRLSHLGLSHNKIRGLPQIFTALAESCPNLEALDLSYLRMASTALINLEKFQSGCQKLKILRLTNTSMGLSPLSLQKQSTSPGFPELVELNLAGFTLYDEICSKPFIDDLCIGRILKASHKLKVLDIRGLISVSHVALTKVPAWDLERLFLAGSGISREYGPGIQWILERWKHSLVEVDLSWTLDKESLDNGLMALSELKDKSQIQCLNLCGSAVSLYAVKAVVMKCPLLNSLNLSSCRALPRGMKRVFNGGEIVTLGNLLQYRAVENKPDLINELLENE